MAALANGFSQGALNGPPFSNYAGSQCAVFDASFARPITQGLSLAKIGNERCVASVRLLLDAGGPTAVARAVPFRIVDSIDCGSRWAFSHVGKEFCKRMPTISNSYSTQTVSFIRGALSNIAARHHACPASICRSSSNCVSQACSCSVTGADLYLSQRAGVSGKCFFADAAFRSPYGLAVLGVSSAGYNKVAKSHAGQVLVSPVMRSAFAALSFAVVYRIKSAFKLVSVWAAKAPLAPGPRTGRTNNSMPVRYFSSVVNNSRQCRLVIQKGFCYAG